MMFRFYYSDGSVFNGAWQDAPARDVQIILYNDPVLGWTLRHGGDFFRLDGSNPVGMDLVGLVDHVVHELGTIKEGRMLTAVQYKAIMDRAVRDRAQLLRARGD